jgi:hypothetical protein
MQWRRVLAVAMAAVVVLGAACADDRGGAGIRMARPSTTETAPTPAPSAAPPPAPTVVAVGDIATCESTDDEAVAELAASLSGPVLLLGDLVYPTGAPESFARCFDPAWGPLRSRLRPAPGNHDYYDRGATGYFGYFPEGVGERGKGWYSFDVGAWHVVALNSNCGAYGVGGCHAGSEQERWLRADLASPRAAAARCTLAFWHDARFSSGGAHGSDSVTSDLWRVLADAGADVVLVGHEHNYERFAPLDPAGNVDAERGIRQFVVGTGGRSHYGFEAPHPGSEARDHTTFGVLELTLHPERYEWRFVPVEGGEFTDAGEDRCH